ncbi:ectoine synthase [Streptomyces sp. NPDC101151]|uniref:ectoine synthase n=1 Tax=Streptomyces sp. NPDC101151 TaxID=3366115 RepID=UPI003822D9DA
MKYIIMIVRRLQDSREIAWGNGTSRRLLTNSDNMGFTVTDTTVRRGTLSRLQYTQHLEACYCISGSGSILSSAGERYDITPDTMYALDEHDAHTLIAASDHDLRLICVFTPALHGDETHVLAHDDYSAYEATP